MKPAVLCPRCHAPLGVRRKGAVHVGNVILTKYTNLWCSACGKAQRVGPRKQ